MAMNRGSGYAPSWGLTFMMMMMTCGLRAEVGWLGLKSGSHLMLLYTCHMNASSKLEIQSACSL